MKHIDKKAAEMAERAIKEAQNHQYSRFVKQYMHEQGIEQFDKTSGCTINGYPEKAYRNFEKRFQSEISVGENINEQDNAKLINAYKTELKIKRAGIAATTLIALGATAYSINGCFYIPPLYDTSNMDVLREKVGLTRALSKNLEDGINATKSNGFYKATPEEIDNLVGMKAKADATIENILKSEEYAEGNAAESKNGEAKEPYAGKWVLGVFGALATYWASRITARKTAKSKAAGILKKYKLMDDFDTRDLKHADYHIWH